MKKVSLYGSQKIDVGKKKIRYNFINGQKENSLFPNRWYSKK